VDPPKHASVYSTTAAGLFQQMFGFLLLYDLCAEIFTSHIRENAFMIFFLKVRFRGEEP
jgi:hypothetical protein